MQSNTLLEHPMEITRHIVHSPDMDGKEVLRLYEKGFRLVCRYCKIEFSTIPETLSPGETPTFVGCSNNMNHMHLLTEPESAMKGVRKAMLARRINKK